MADYYNARWLECVGFDEGKQEIVNVKSAETQSCSSSDQIDYVKLERFFESTWDFNNDFTYDLANLTQNGTSMKFKCKRTNNNNNNNNKGDNKKTKEYCYMCKSYCNENGKLSGDLIDGIKQQVFLFSKLGKYPQNFARMIGFGSHLIDNMKYHTILFEKIDVTLAQYINLFPIIYEKDAMFLSIQQSDHSALKRIYQNKWENIDKNTFGEISYYIDDNNNNNCGKSNDNSKYNDNSNSNSNNGNNSNNNNNNDRDSNGSMFCDFYKILMILIKTAYAINLLFKEKFEIDLTPQNIGILHKNVSSRRQQIYKVKLFDFENVRCINSNDANNIDSNELDNSSNYYSSDTSHGGNFGSTASLASQPQMAEGNVAFDVEHSWLPYNLFGFGVISYQCFTKFEKKFPLRNDNKKLFCSLPRSPKSKKNRAKMAKLKKTNHIMCVNTKHKKKRKFSQIDDDLKNDFDNNNNNESETKNNHYNEFDNCNDWPNEKRRRLRLQNNDKNEKSKVLLAIPKNAFDDLVFNCETELKWVVQHCTHPQFDKRCSINHAFDIFLKQFLIYELQLDLRIKLLNQMQIMQSKLMLKLDINDQNQTEFENEKENGNNQDMKNTNKNKSKSKNKNKNKNNKNKRELGVDDLDWILDKHYFKLNSDAINTIKNENGNNEEVIDVNKLLSKKLGRYFIYCQHKKCINKTNGKFDMNCHGLLGWLKHHQHNRRNIDMVEL